MKWFADNSELNGIKEAEIPDIVLFGGIAVRPETEIALKACIEKVKQEYGSLRAPVKWNMKDLRDTYERQNQLELYEKMLKSSEAWRPRIFECLANTDATIILACIEGYSTRREVLKKTKEGLVRYAFNNALMRVGLHAQETGTRGTIVVMDWPDGGVAKPFNSEYAYAYGQGTTADKSVKYNCGKLCDLGFMDSPVFTNMRHSTLLQTADLVVGATRELVECCLEKRSPGQGVENLKKAKARFRGAPNNILGRGLSVSSGNEKLESCIAAGLKKFL